jgi:hypothetical protein
MVRRARTRRCRGIPSPGEPETDFISACHFAGTAQVKGGVLHLNASAGLKAPDRGFDP